jgi:nucleotide-binding universal stress UspA family protein
VTYSTLLVHLDGARPNASVLDAAATLAKRYDAKVIGIASCQPIQIGTFDGYIDGALAVAERDIVSDELARAKMEFQAHGGIRPFVLEWRSIPTLDTVASTVAQAARCADLIITSIGPLHGNPSTHADPGNLILRAGRPVLVVPEANSTSAFCNVLVAWSNTRECRRAIMDALPILHGADRVTIVEASSDPIGARASIQDIAGWLARHRIIADRISSRIKGSPSETLEAIANDVEADLVVAGAYGHSRIREWAFGGVTRDLLLHERRCTFLSH